MVLRKVIKFGNSSFVITLPFDWVRKHNLDKGEKVSVRQSESSIIVSLKASAKEKHAVVKATNKPLKLLNKEVISYYLKNFQTITIQGKDILEHLEHIRTIKDKLSSVEMIEIKSDRIVLKDLTGVSKLDICQLIKEIVEMEKILFEELQKEENRQFFITSMDTNINKLSFLAYKAINYQLEQLKEPDQVKDGVHYWRIVSSLEEMGDKIKTISRYLKDKDGSPQYVQTNAVIKMIYEYFCFVVDLLEDNAKLENNLKSYLDKKQSLLIEFEKLRMDFKDDLTLYLVLTQLFKDLLGDIDDIVLSIVDIKLK